MSESTPPRDQEPTHRITRRQALTLGGSLIAASFIAGTAVYARSQGFSLSDENAGSTQSVDYENQASSSLSAAQKKLREGFKNAYDPVASAKVRTELDAQIAQPHGENDPYLVHDPFNTNAASAYLYFTTDDPVSLAYTIHAGEADDAPDTAAGTSTDIPDFTRTLPGGAATTHEHLLVGLVLGRTNTITLTLTPESGTPRTRTLSLTVPKARGDEELRLTSTAGTSDTPAAEGLYAILGNDSTKLDFMLYYDNDGVLRGEVPIIDYRSHRVLFADAGTNGIIYSVSNTQLARVDRLGQTLQVYRTGDYELHHDYVFDDAGNILVLATDTTSDSVEDVIVRINLTSGDVTEVLDLSDLFPDYKKTCQVASDGDLDWMHVNSIAWVGNDAIIISCREVSTIMRIEHLSTKPTVAWMLADRHVWEGTAYEDLVFDQASDFPAHAGQHAVTYVADESLPDGQFYLYLYNNNLGFIESRPDFDWTVIDGVGTAYDSKVSSSYYRYLVDENERTFELVKRFALPYSAYVSDVQHTGAGTLDQTVVFCSGMAGTFGERTADGEKIATYEIRLNNKYVYRVMKYDFKGFYFA